MTDVRLHCGPPNSGRSAHLTRVFLARLPQSLLLTPTQSHADALIERVAREATPGGLWGRRILPLAGFVAELLRLAGLKVRQLTEYERRLLLEECLLAPDLGVVLPENAVGQTAGLARHLLRIITGLKQAAIEPEEFARKTSGETDSMDALVAAAYASYQKRLRDLQLYDVPGLYWEADLQCRAGRPEILDGITQLVLDGFDDFTPSEFRLMVALAPHVGQLHIGLNYDERPDRQDLFVLPRRAVRQISREFGVAAIAHDSAAPRSYSEYAAEHLFWRDTPGWRPDMAPNLRVRAYSGMLHEVEDIGRQVKALLLAGEARPDEIAIVYRDLSEAGPLLDQALREFGIPHKLRCREPLMRSGVAGLLLRVLEAAGSWHREQVVELLLSPLLKLPRDRHRGTYPALAKHALIIAGYPAWQARLESLSARLASGESRDARDLLAWMPQAAEAVAELQQAIHWLRELGESLPNEASPGEFATSVDRLLLALGIADAVLRLPDAYSRARETRALAAVRAVLETFAASAMPQTAIARSQFAERLTLALEEADVAPPDDAAGVLCTDAAGLRNLRFRHVFFGAMNEGHVPGPPAGNAVYSELDRTRLRAAGVHLEGRLEHSARERLLFHHVLLSATGTLTLSWRLTHKGREALPSHYLLELQELFKDQDPLFVTTPGTDAFLPEALEIASGRDLRNAVFFARNRLDRYHARFPEVSASAAMEHLRQESAEWSAYDGVMSDPGIVRAIQTEFGPDHEFSAGQLEQYLGCPFRYFVERVLGVTEVEAPEVVLDARARGVILHDTLRRLHQHHVGQPVSGVPAENLHAWAREALDAAFAQHAWMCAAATPSLLALERLRLRRMLDLYVGIARQDEEPWAPAHFEVAFGGAPRSGSDPVSSSTPLVLDAVQGILLSGRVDRIDRNDEALRIVDYKSGSVPAVKDINEGRNLQLVLYAMAVEQMLAGGAACTEAVYLAIGRNKRCVAFNTGRRNDREAFQQCALESVRRAVAGIRAGFFPPDPEGHASCAGCGGTHPCRFERARTERKLQQCDSAQ